MIKYIVTALPRSGTAWLSTFLNRQDLPCIHEATGRYTIDELVALGDERDIGVVDTALWMSPKAIEFLSWRFQPSVVKLVRPIKEVNESLQVAFPGSTPVEKWSVFPRWKQLKCASIPYESLGDTDSLDITYSTLTGHDIDPLWLDQMIGRKIVVRPSGYPVVMREDKINNFMENWL